MLERTEKQRHQHLSLNIFTKQNCKQNYSTLPHLRRLFAAASTLLPEFRRAWTTAVRSKPSAYKSKFYEGGGVKVNEVTLTINVLMDSSSGGGSWKLRSTGLSLMFPYKSDCPDNTASCSRCNQERPISPVLGVVRFAPLALLVGVCGKIADKAVATVPNALYKKLQH